MEINLTYKFDSEDALRAHLCHPHLWGCTEEEADSVIEGIKERSKEGINRMVLEQSSFPEESP